MATPEEIAAAQAAARAAANARVGPSGKPIIGGVSSLDQIGAAMTAAQMQAGATAKSQAMSPLASGAPIAGGTNLFSSGVVPPIMPTTPSLPAVDPNAVMTVPNIGFNTTGNIVIGGRDKAGKANDFSGSNIGANAAYVTPNGQGATIGGTGARADSGGIGPAQSRNAVGPAAGLVAPLSSDLTKGAAGATGTSAAGVPQAVTPGAGSVTSPAPQTGAVGFAGIPTSGPAFDAANAPYGVGRTAAAGAALMDPQIKRANDIQDTQLALAQRAIALAGTGNLSDAIMAKHIRSTIAAIGGAQTAGAGAVNPLKQTQAQTATQERDTDVQAASSAHSVGTQAAVTARGQDIEAFFKLPAHTQAMAMAQLQAKAASGGPEAAGALEQIRQITLAQDKAQMNVLGPMGNTVGAFANGRWYAAPASFGQVGAGGGIGADAARQRLGLVTPGVQ